MWLGAAERLVHRRFIAPLPEEREIAGRALPDPRRHILDGVLDDRHRRQRSVVDVDQFQGVLRLIQGFGDGHGDGVADEPHPVAGQQRPAGARRLRAVAMFDRHGAGQIAEAGGGDVRAGVNRENAGRALAAAVGIDTGDLRMRMGRAQEQGMDLTRQRHVSGEASLAGEQPRILRPGNRLAQSEFSHQVPFPTRADGSKARPDRPTSPRIPIRRQTARP